MNITRPESEKFTREAAADAALSKVVSTLPTINTFRAGGFTGDQSLNGTYIEDGGGPHFVESFLVGDAVGTNPVGR